jgi:phage host-nuclease inhibitor protein Gam
MEPEKKKYGKRNENRGWEITAALIEVGLAQREITRLASDENRQVAHTHTQRKNPF